MVVVVMMVYGIVGESGNTELFSSVSPETSVPIIRLPGVWQHQQQHTRIPNINNNNSQKRIRIRSPVWKLNEFSPCPPHSLIDPDLTRPAHHPLCLCNWHYSDICCKFINSMHQVNLPNPRQQRWRRIASQMTFLRRAGRQPRNRNRALCCGL